jgi:DNA polymerase-3 subunit gamma/tau
MKATKALALKYRPKTFDDVVEQGPVKQILQEQLRTKTHQNCYLFTGGAGTGKTTCARIFANDVNEGEGNPIEIDAASNNGVDNVREIIEDAKFKALDALYKVYIIDECHSLSTGAWNAMLKLIEEPPAQTVFIFCTTDPQKIPATIISRVQRYDFQRITYESIVARLKHILDAENEEILSEGGPDGAIIYDMEALGYVAKLADGGMRDAITLLDKCLSFSLDISVQNVVQALGTIDYDTMFDLTEAIVDMRAGDAVVIIEGAHRSGVDLKQFIKQYSYFVLDAYKYFLIGDFEYLQIPSTYADKLDSWDDDTYYFLQDLLAEIIKLNADIKWEPSPKPLIESTVILLCQEEQ